MTTGRILRQSVGFVGTVAPPAPEEFTGPRGVHPGVSLLSPPRHSSPPRSAPRHVAPPSRSAITLRSVLLLSLAVVSVLWIHRRAGATAIFFGIYGSGAVSYLVAKLALAAAYRAARLPGDPNAPQRRQAQGAGPAVSAHPRRDHHDDRLRHRPAAPLCGGGVKALP